MANRTRPIILRLAVTEYEKRLIENKMQQIGTENFGAYARNMSHLNARIADQNLSCKQEKSKVMKNLFWNCSAPTADLQKRNPHSGQKMFVTKLERWPRTI